MTKSQIESSLPDTKFPKAIRLLNAVEFDAVFGNDVFAADDTLVINAVQNQLGRTRLGLSIGRKVGNAVVRNRWKRIIREAFRLNRSKLPVGIDFVVRPRKGAQCEFAAISVSLEGLLRRLAKKLPRSPDPGGAEKSTVVTSPNKNQRRT